jgi:hypothetical protein
MTNIFQKKGNVIDTKKCITTTWIDHIMRGVSITKATPKKW